VPIRMVGDRPYPGLAESRQCSVGLCACPEHAPKQQLSIVEVMSSEPDAEFSHKWQERPQCECGCAEAEGSEVTHGLFVKQLHCGSAPEIIEQMEALTAGLREYFHPVGMMEEILMEKVVVETARYRRILGHEHIELARKHAFFSAAVDRVGRYSTTINRSLFRAIEELERLQAARKAVQGAAVSSDQETPETAAKNLPEE